MSNNQGLDKKLDFSAMSRELEEAYRNSLVTQGISVLLLGEVGAGKTFFARTAPKPVYIDVFDPGGAVGLRNLITPDSGIIADVRWSTDDLYKPTAFRDWRQEIKKRLSNGFFEQVGTYVLDSATMWAEAIVRDIMARRNSPGKLPDDYKTHWKPQKEAIREGIDTLMSQPCNFILTGHLKPVYAGKSQDKRIVGYKMNTVGDLAEYIPQQMDEIWLASKKKAGPRSIEYYIQTESTGLYDLRSRLKADGVLDPIEPADFRAILKKAGFPHEDKPF